MPSVFADGITILYCSSPPPATIKKEGKSNDLSSMVAGGGLEPPTSGL